ncbi:YifB family Mg chelatase-like AAA ATPase [Candidatus Finniella inopinata]|uniref:ATP-binding protein n=1 Tax=Candidatus Finniella inopinata TaxID=1696036 RepID=A0A4Q7DJB1_9PROT|nr:YifB family Mg chelatase-like AAA ATPase [Candidatus Finniella inopinata]RZI46430.1 ATP-binding protein [Candidatus Finniella inopinata]
MGLSLPPKRITVNLAPADIQKEGSHYDLPIALGLMAAMDGVELSQYTALGELGLDGRLAAVVGVLPAAMNALMHHRGLICPEVSSREAAWAGDLKILAAPNLLALMNHFKGTQVLRPPVAELAPASLSNGQTVDLKDIKGQSLAKRALEIAAAGGHNILMMGPPGAGKSMLARCLPSLLPPLEPAEALEVTMIHSLAGLLPESGLIHQRPFRDPHHSASLVSLVGGGNRVKPGEISLAHQGVLFLDELPEFSRPTLESLRQPLETGKIVVARANNHATYPARIQLVAAMNPCRCGYFGDLERQCHRAPVCANDYQNKISGPLLDRFDLLFHVQALNADELLSQHESEPSHVVANRVRKARKRQQHRHQNLYSWLNATIDGDHLKQIAELDEEGKALLGKAVEKLRLSARSYHRILRVSRTIADLEESQSIRKHHIAETLGYRQKT